MADILETNMAAFFRFTYETIDAQCCLLSLFSSGAFFFYARLRTYAQYASMDEMSLRVLSTPYVHVGRKYAALEINHYRDQCTERVPGI